ncbi:MAG TPA: response regulator [Candidatus Saccharimonadales bacterium]|jgi:CheY-like chemotaxis protein
MAKIMLVEDDTNLSEIYQARLAAEGYEIVSAHDGEEALALAAKEKPDLIISDVMMPKISGFEMLDILRNTDGLKATKVIMLTALGQAEDKTRAEGLGADRYLVKSQVTLEDIVKAAQELLLEGASPPATVAPAVAVPAPIPVAPSPPIPAAAVAAQPTPMTTIPVTMPPIAPASATTPIPVTAVASAPAAAAPSTIPPSPPQPAAAPIEPPNPNATADNKLVTDAVEGLLEGVGNKPTATPKPQTTPIVTTQSPVPLAKPAPPETTLPKATPLTEPEPARTTDLLKDQNIEPDKNSEPSGGDHVTVAHKKIIAPIDDPAFKKPDLNSLLAAEENKNPGTINQPIVTSDAAGQTTAKLATSAPHQPGHVIAPDTAATDLNQGGSIDPGSIAL